MTSLSALPISSALPRPNFTPLPVKSLLRCSPRFFQPVFPCLLQSCPTSPLLLPVSSALIFRTHLLSMVSDLIAFSFSSLSSRRFFILFLSVPILFSDLLSAQSLLSSPVFSQQGGPECRLRFLSYCGRAPSSKRRLCSDVHVPDGFTMLRKLLKTPKTGLSDRGVSDLSPGSSYRSPCFISARPLS
jgi:hypothetical protein